MNRWTRKTVREYAPYTRWDWNDPMHRALDIIPTKDCDLFKQAYWSGQQRSEIAGELGIGPCHISTCLGRICDDIARLMNLTILKY